MAYRPSLSCGVYGSYLGDFGTVRKLKQNEDILRSLINELNGGDTRLESLEQLKICQRSQSRKVEQILRAEDEAKKRDLLPSFFDINAQIEELQTKARSDIRELKQRLEERMRESERLRNEITSSMANLQRAMQEQASPHMDDEKNVVDDAGAKQKEIMLNIASSQRIASAEKEQDSQANDDEKKVEDVPTEEEVKQNEIMLDVARSQHNTAKIFECAKKVYKKRGSPVIVDEKNVLDDVKQNARNYKNVALPMTLAQDKPFESWNEDEFKREFSRKFNIPIGCIRIISVRAGSTLIDMEINTHDSGAKMLIPIECIAENLSSKKAKKELAEFGIFAMMFKEPTAGFSASQQRVIMNPRWNRAYGKGTGETYWEGPLNDGKSRGGKPYFCPSGWKRYAVQFSETAYDFEHVYDKWPIAYHGTTFSAHYLITLSGLKCSYAEPPCGVHGSGVYLSPSIKYVSHSRYCPPVRLDLKAGKKAGWASQHLAEWKKYDGKWIQCAFACRVKPGSFLEKCQTMGLGTGGKFDGIDKKVIEWLVPGKGGDIIGSDKILIYGYMIKVSDSKPTDY